jgi:alkylhydroperoxidase family enzyme
MARIEPLPIKQWPPEMRDAFAAMLPPNPRHPRPIAENRPGSRNTLGAFAHHPALARAFLGFNGHILMATTLTERHRELLVLRVAARRRSPYLWAQHVFMANDAGISDEEIARVAFGPDAPFWAVEEAALLRAVDELVDDGAIADATWQALASTLSEQQLLDMIFTVGAYETIAWMMRSLDLDLDDDIPGLFAQKHSIGGAHD